MHKPLIIEPPKSYPTCALVEFHKYAGKGMRSGRVFVNPKYVMAVEEDASLTAIQLTGRFVAVVEPLEEVVKALQGHND